MGEGFKWLVDLFVPTMEHDPVKQYLWRWRVAIFGCMSFTLIGYTLSAMLFEFGPAMIRPASAQTVQQVVKKAAEPIQAQLGKVSAVQDERIRLEDADRLERLEQQLLWYREKNCSSATGEAKRLYFSKMMELYQRYHTITGADWRVPDCKEVDGP